MPLNPYESPTTPPDEGPTKPLDASFGNKLFTIRLRLLSAYALHAIIGWMIFATQLFAWGENLDWAKKRSATDYFEGLIFVPFLDLWFGVASIFVFADPINTFSTLVLFASAIKYAHRGTWPYLLLTGVASAIQFRNVLLVIDMIVHVT
jgi:hypothetical protein